MLSARRVKKILVVEDNEKNMYLVTYILKNGGYEVIECWNGEEGIKMAIKEKPDLILMDLQLPDMNGLEAVKKIRESTDGEVPIIALTSFAMVGDKKKAFDAGCTGYIEKPINPDTFLDHLKGFI